MSEKEKKRERERYREKDREREREREREIDVVTYGVPSGRWKMQARTFKSGNTQIQTLIYTNMEILPLRPLTQP